MRRIAETLAVLLLSLASLQAAGLNATSPDATGLKASGPDATSPDATGLKAAGLDAIGPEADDHTAVAGTDRGSSSEDPASTSQATSLEDSFLVPEQERDSVLIADQLRYGFHLRDVAEGTGLALPDFKEGFMDKVEVVSPWRIDTVKTSGKNKGPKTYDLDVSVLITSFDEGKYELRPLSAVKLTASGKSDTLVFDPQVLDVRAMPVDTATFQVHDIKGQVRYPLTFAELVPWILGSLASAALLALAIFLWTKRKRAAATAPKEPPHLVALRKLDSLRGDKYWAPELQKQFYSGITDALKEYVVSRFRIDALEMTTSEIFIDLKKASLPKDLFEETKALFETADFVKFAKALATKEENAAAIPTAVRFVTTTYQSQIEEEEKTAQAGMPQAGMAQAKAGQAAQVKAAQAKVGRSEPDQTMTAWKNADQEDANPADAVPASMPGSKEKGGEA